MQDLIVNQHASINLDGAGVPPPEMDKIEKSLLGLAVTFGLLQKHTTLLETILTLLPEGTGRAFLDNDGATKILPAEAIAQLIAQQTKANIIHRELENVKTHQYLTSENRAVQISLIHELPHTLGEVTEVKESILKTMNDFSADELNADQVEE